LIAKNSQYWLEDDFPKILDNQTFMHKKIGSRKQKSNYLFNFKTYYGGTNLTKVFLKNKLII